MRVLCVLPFRVLCVLPYRVLCVLPFIVNIYIYIPVDVAWQGDIKMLGMPRAREPRGRMHPAPEPWGVCCDDGRGDSSDSDMPGLVSASPSSSDIDSGDSASSTDVEMPCLTRMRYPRERYRPLLEKPAHVGCEMKME